MFARCGKFLLVVALAGSIGLHWGLLQAVAWAGMVISYSQEDPLREAVVKTFDGQHPCPLCKEIAKGKQSEKKPDYNFEMGKLEFPYTPAVFVFCPPSWFWEVWPGNDGARFLNYAPPVPPPRAAIV